MLSTISVPTRWKNAKGIRSHYLKFHTLKGNRLDIVQYIASGKARNFNLTLNHMVIFQARSLASFVFLH